MNTLGSIPSLSKEHLALVEDENGYWHFPEPPALGGMPDDAPYILKSLLGSHYDGSEPIALEDFALLHRNSLRRESNKGIRSVPDGRLVEAQRRYYSRVITELMLKVGLTPVLTFGARKPTQSAILKFGLRSYSPDVILPALVAELIGHLTAVEKVRVYTCDMCHKSYTSERKPHRDAPQYCETCKPIAQRNYKRDWSRDNGSKKRPPRSDGEQQDTGPKILI